MSTKEYIKNWREKNADKVRGYSRAFRDRDPRRSKSFSLKHRFGITLDEFEAMVERQGGACLICGKVPDKLHVDHDHSTRRVRGLLCGTCNRGLGMFYDSPEALRSAAEYLTSTHRDSSGQAGPT